jgi:hypothetical protein
VSREFPGAGRGAGNRACGSADRVRVPAAGDGEGDGALEVTGAAGEGEAEGAGAGVGDAALTGDSAGAGHLWSLHSTCIHVVSSRSRSVKPNLR